MLAIAPMRLRAIASNDLDDVEQYLMEKGQEQYDRISWYMTITFLVKEKKRKGRRKKGG